MERRILRRLVAGEPLPQLMRPPALAASTTAADLVRRTSALVAGSGLPGSGRIARSGSSLGRRCRKGPYAAVLEAADTRTSAQGAPRPDGDRAEGTPADITLHGHRRAADHAWHRHRGAAVEAAMRRDDADNVSHGRGTLCRATSKSSCARWLVGQLSGPRWLCIPRRPDYRRDRRPARGRCAAAAPITEDLLRPGSPVLPAIGRSRPACPVNQVRSGAAVH